MALGLALLVASAAGASVGSYRFEPSGAVEAGSPVVWRFHYRPGETGIAPGGSLLLRFPHPYYFMFPLNWLPEPGADGALPVSAHAASGTEVRARLGDRGWHPRPVVVELPAGLAAGDELTLVVGSAGGERPSLAPRYAVRDFVPLLLVDADSSGVLAPAEARSSLEVRAAAPVGCRLLAASEARRGQAIPLTVRLEDRFGNVAPARQEVAVELRLEGADAAAASTVVRFAPNGEGWQEVSGPAAAACGVVRVVATSALGGGTVRSNPVRVSDGPAVASHFWGDLHGHSAMSDGSGSGEEYYRAASGPAALDVVALSDHEWQLDAGEWATVERLCRDHDRPGELVPLLAWEYSLGGHRVVYSKSCTGTPPAAAFDGPKELWQVEYNHDPIRSWTRGGDGRPLLDFASSAALFADHRGTDTLIVPHTSATSHMGNDWDAHDPSLVRLVEIYSAHGSDEAAASPRPVAPFVERGSAQAALARGYRLGFIACGDSHDGHPGRSLSGRWPGGLTAILAPRLDRDAVWQALSSRRVYATTGARILLDLEVAGEPMGGEVVAAGPVEVRLEAHGVELLDRVEVVGAGGVVAGFAPAALDFATTVEMPPCAAVCWYYLRVVQRDGEMAWSSPAWVTSPAVPGVEGLRAFPAGREVHVEWQVGPGGPGRVEVWRRLGDDGGGAVEHFRLLETVGATPGRKELVDPDVPAGITAHYLLRWAPVDGAGATPVSLGLVSALLPAESPASAGVDGYPVDYWVEEPGTVRIDIVDLRQRTVRSAVREHAAPGLARYVWDTLDDAGQPCRGLHFVTVTSAAGATQRQPIRLGEVKGASRVRVPAAVERGASR
ncbi:MAG: hypothetical protein C3F15_00080 [Holophagae bacterium]|nr:MAG: hypothetical protein C3F15_00080 [Holophagae bacterium]